MSVIHDRLAREFKATGNQEVRKQLIKEGDELVQLAANSFHNRPYITDHDDVIQEGRVGLLGAIERYDDSKGASFSAYALKCIKGTIQLRFYADSTQMGSVSRGRKFATSSMVLGRLAPGTPKTIEEEEKVMTDKERHLISAAHKHNRIVLDADRVNTDTYEIEAPDNTTEAVDSEDKYNFILSRIRSDRARYVVDNFIRCGRTFADIGRDLKITGVQVSRIYNGAIKDLQSDPRIVID